MSLRILVIGDPHFKCNNQSDTDVLVKEVLTLIEKQPLDMIVVLGDTLDRHEVIHLGAMNRAIDFLAAISETLPVFLLIGNHDLRNNRQFLTEEHSFAAVKYWDQPRVWAGAVGRRITVVDKPVVIRRNELKMAFVPYVPPGRFVEALNTVKQKGQTWEDSDLIFCHQEFRGAQLSNELRSTTGDELKCNHPPIISGHIHTAHQVPGQEIYYPGTPYPENFGETGEKIVLIVNLVSGERLSSHHMEPVRLNVLRKQTIEVNFSPREQFQAKDVEIRQLLDQQMQLRVRITVHKSELALLKDDRYRKEWERRGVKIVKQVIDTSSSPFHHEHTGRRNLVAMVREVIQHEQEKAKVFNELFPC